MGLLSNNSNNKYEIKQLAIGGGTHTAGLGITSVVIPNTVIEIGKGSFYDNKLTNVIIPGSVTSIGDAAFANNQITSITFPDTPITVDCYAFDGNPIMEDQSYSFPSNVTVSCVKN